MKPLDPPTTSEASPVAVVEPTREGATALKVGHADRDRATWIFQANPALYDIHRSLKLEAREWWGCLQHTGRIRAGDRVLIWMHWRDQKAVYETVGRRRRPAPGAA